MGKKYEKRGSREGLVVEPATTKLPQHKYGPVKHLIALFKQAFETGVQARENETPTTQALDPTPPPA